MNGDLTEIIDSLKNGRECRKDERRRHLGPFFKKFIHKKASFCQFLMQKNKFALEKLN